MLKVGHGDWIDKCIASEVFDGIILTLPQISAESWGHHWFGSERTSVHPDLR